MAKIELQDVTKRYQEDVSIAKLSRWRPPLPGNAIEADNAPKESRGSVRALDGLNLTVENGETMVVVGPSGCGKSTLLRVVAGLIEHDGVIAYDGEDMYGVPAGDRRIGMVFQSYALYPHFYGKGNLRFFFQVNQAPDAEAEERIRVTSDLMGFGFKELLRRKPGTLSGGQQQRLAIARALVRQPRLFLFDEPLSNLDAKLRTRTRVEIKRLLHRFGITAMYVTHDQTEAMALGDRVAVMREGRIEQVGTFMEILNDPANAFVAGFLGLPPMNLLKGTVAGTQIVLGENRRIPVPNHLLPSVNQGQQITVGIRPENAQVKTGDTKSASSGEFPGAKPPGQRNGAQQDGEVIFKGTVEVVEPDFGRRRQTAYVKVGAFACNVTARLEERLVTGYDVIIRLPLSALYFFDTASGKRLR
jgi:ABC-type sugar transport system ATPase subunit